ncbi:DNA topoisomerase 2 isoform X2 [Daphnia magna]|nr:DNA topoisomerase 2 isoform X2 [Daphnia magna]XP_032783706.2 DNA topoisomerase 2 isoform X2 [Daphnia magna]XP_032783707.2 DNA topoisomerase 2 isoform X2 [Daphnia magna]
MNKATTATVAAETNGDASKTNGANKRLSVERIYQKKSQLEHILLRPDTYIGSVEPVKEVMWVYEEEAGMVQREITYVPGLYKIFDEILVNAADNKVRDSTMDMIKVDIDPVRNVISIYNNGKGIPVVEHKEEKMYVPSLIFGHLLTSSNYNDEEEKVTGGRNGYGAKLCNIFSTSFELQTASKEERKKFTQTWTNNMTKAGAPKIISYSDADFTKITFSPDLEKFKMPTLDQDTVALLSRRAFDVAASTRGVKVFLNGKRLPIKNFKDYVDLCLKGKDDDDGNQLKCVYEAVSDRWEIAVAPSDKGFQQVSFVNSIATTKGGRHVDYITEIVSKHLQEFIKKKNKSGVNIKPHQIKNHLWIFVNCLIVNPTFDSQTKENMTLQAKSFGSTCKPTEKFFTALNKSGVIEGVMQWAKFKAQTELNKNCSGKKHSKLKGIPKLEDANNAGTRYSIDCTLILTEGDSAKSLAVSGLGVVGRDKFGVFPLKGKVLNVREATHKQIMENAEINNLIKILGLQYKKKYETIEDLKTLRYGRLMIMTDQDQDGSHIKGLLINFLHHNWPSLLRLPFLEEFITPIVKATKGTGTSAKTESFYSLPEFEEWKSKTDNWPTYRIKYYKGLGTSTSQEAKGYFSDMQRHRILFEHDGDQDDYAILMAFSKKHVEQRKEWLTSWMEECKRRRELGLPELYLYEKDTKKVSYRDFVNKELVLFSNMDNERSIPSLMDGFKPGQRKVLFTCIKRNDKKEIKVAQLAGSVAEHSAYHHGEASLMGTIIGLAQDFVGSNNINLLLPNGQFGTRLQGGKDAASPRYIFTLMNKVTRAIFHPHDDPLLKHQMDDNQRIEPEYYVPIIPMILVNGTDGIGTGWMTKILNYNPHDIVANVRRMLDGEEPLEMDPWFKGYRGTIERIDRQRYVISGEVAVLSPSEVEITELPLRVWTQNYKESVMETLLHGSEKTPPLITDYKEYHTDTTVRFVVSMAEDKMQQAEAEGLHKAFKLQATHSLTSMVLYDPNGCLKMYDSVEDILKEFFTVRLGFYVKRKDYLSGVLQAESKRLSNQARFICEKCDNVLIVENKKAKVLVEELRRRNYDPDPVRVWKKNQKNNVNAEEEEEQEANAENEEGAVKIGDYDYLLDMPMRSLTYEKKEELLKKRDIKMKEYDILLKKTPADLWREDLDNFLVQLQDLENAQQEEAKENKKSAKLPVGAKGKKKALAVEVAPSPKGRRIVPVVDAELRKKAEKATIAKEKKKERALKKESPEVERDSFDDALDESNKSLSDKLGLSPTTKGGKGKKGAKNADGLKQTKLNFASNKSAEKDDDIDEFDMALEEAKPLREKTMRRAAAAAAKFVLDSDEEEGDASDNDSDLVISDSDEDFDFVKPKTATKKRAKGPPISSDDDNTAAKRQKKANAPNVSSDDLFDSLVRSSPVKTTVEAESQSPPDIVMLGSDDDAKPKGRGRGKVAKTDGPGKPRKAPAPKAAAAPKTTKTAASKAKPKASSPKKKASKDSDSDDMFASKTQTKKAISSDGNEDDSFDFKPRATTGRAKKPVKYANLSSDEDMSS